LTGGPDKAGIGGAITFRHHILDNLADASELVFSRANYTGQVPLQKAVGQAQKIQYIRVLKHERGSNVALAAEDDG
jgi:hypothetical protein